MTDRVKGLVVTLDQDIRTDDVEAIISAIRMVKYVVDVKPNVTQLDDHINRTRIKMELQQKLYDVLK